MQFFKFDKFETQVEETLARSVGIMTTTDQVASGKRLVSRPVLFRSSNPYLQKIKSTELKSRSESHRSFSTTASEQERRQAKIEKKLAQLELEVVERQSKLELVSMREICLFASNLFNKLPLKTQKKTIILHFEIKTN